MATGSRMNFPKQKALRYIPIGSHVKIKWQGIGEQHFGKVESNRNGWVYICLYNSFLAKRKRKNVWLHPHPELFSKDVKHRYLSVGDQVRFSDPNAVNYDEVGEVKGTFLINDLIPRVVIETRRGTRIRINSSHVTLIAYVEARA